ncbi:hypothetical protein SAMN06265222_101226 [Neorhodopirellula lusitana]|uniref:Uncharacterized protein n=1 Tax=Neorhodopirellula lusitana TaxID=445327 RepID=A0ABY1PNM2_9BACT|nr:hypothetical protein SAMN06265222_101226 [Neorhodopirellula lusitana]
MRILEVESCAARIVLDPVLQNGGYSHTGTASETLTPYRHSDDRTACPEHDGCNRGSDCRGKGLEVDPIG